MRKPWITTLIIVSMLMMWITACGSKNRKMSVEEVTLKCQKFYQVRDGLNDEFKDYTTAKEYLIVNGEGKKLKPAEVLDFSELISVMDELEPYCYFALLNAFLEESGYGTPESWQEGNDLFFTLSEKEKAEVLSCMFLSVGEVDVYKDQSIDINAEIYILRGFIPIDRETGEDIPKK